MTSARGILAALAFVAPVACGSRTGLLTSGSGQEVTFDAGCREASNLWLLFDLVGDTGTGSTSIYAMRADGTHGHPLTLPHAPAFFPSISPDGSKLLYATYLPPEAGNGGNDSAVYMFDLASHTATLLVETTGLTYSALSPDGQTLSYVSGYSLHDVGVDGTGDRTLLAGPDGNGTGFGHPTFASDSRTIVYGAGGYLGAIAIDGSQNRTLVASTLGEYPNGAFSPDYQRLVMGATCSRTSSEALLVFDYASLPGPPCGDGQLLVDVFPGSAPNSANDPSWGSNGLIAYGSGQDVFVIDPAGGAPRNMTAMLTGDGGATRASDPVWAPGCASLP